MPSKVQLFGPDDKNTTIWSPGSEQNPHGCANVYSSLFVEGYFYKVCPTGFSSNQLYLTLPAGFVSSTVSQEDATQAARELLAAKGAELAEAEGVCTLGDFQEVFSTVDATFNWDWVADKETLFPREFKNTLPDGFGFGTGTDGGIMIEYPIGNSVTWPLMVGFFYSDTTLFLDETANEFAPTEALRVDIHDPYGLMHMDFRNFLHATRPNLTVYAGRDSNENADITDSSTYTLHTTSLYAGKLVADFGSREIYGPPWDEDVDGPGDNPFKPNETAIPEFTVATLGGFLFRIDTASRSVINGKLAGVYLVCYKDDIQVYKYDVGADDYVSVGQIPFSPKNKTMYYGASILFDGTNKFLEIYLDGQFELSIADDTLTNIHLPVCYQRGVFSVDHWIGDIVSGATYPGTNRLPPPITTKYFEPTDIINPDVQSPTEPLKKILFPAEIVGASTLLEANKPFPKLAAGEVGVGFNKDLPDANSKVGAWFGGVFFGQAVNILMNFDLSVYPELGKILWGAHVIQVGKIEMARYSEVPNIPSNPYKFLMNAYQLYPIIPAEDIPGIDWTEYPLFDLWWEAYNQHPRWSCSWDGAFQPSDLFSGTEAVESGNATEIEEPTDTEEPSFQAGLYNPAPKQSGDGWLYTTSMITLTPGRVASFSSTGEFTDLLTKEDIINHYYFFTEGWFGTQVITDLYSAIRTVKFMTGVQGKRTSEVLEPPEYDFNYSCPTPPTFDFVPVNLKCPNKEFVVKGKFFSTAGGTINQLSITSIKDCLFGDPYADVCYPSRNTWFAGFNFIALLTVESAGFNQALALSLVPNPSELVYSGAALLDKLFVEFPKLNVKVYREGWPGVIYSTTVDLRLSSSNPPATTVGYSTAVEACYFVPPSNAIYDETFGLDHHLNDFVDFTSEFKFVFTLPDI